MRCTSYVLLLALLLISTPSHAQDESVEDTLDWRGYYPLAIGNAWEYKFHVSGGSDNTTTSTVRLSGTR